ncbi:MAG: hypothetical protein ACKOVH_06230 [Actinomycetota bacterium]
MSVGTFLTGLRLVVVVTLLAVAALAIAGLALFAVVLIVSCVIGFF